MRLPTNDVLTAKAEQQLLQQRDWVGEAPVPRALRQHHGEASRRTWHLWGVQPPAHGPSHPPPHAPCQGRSTKPKTQRPRDPGEGWGQGVSRWRETSCGSGREEQRGPLGQPGRVECGLRARPVVVSGQWLREGHPRFSKRAWIQEGENTPLQQTQTSGRADRVQDVLGASLSLPQLCRDLPCPAAGSRRGLSRAGGGTG